MIRKEEAKEILLTCLKTGGDFAEIFLENTIQNDLELSDGNLSKSNTSFIYGAGIRILHEDQEVYGYTNDTSYDGLLNLACSLTKSFNYEAVPLEFDFIEEKIENKHLAKKQAKNAENEEKSRYLKTVYEAVANYHENISQVIASIWDHTQEVTIFNTEGKMITDTRNHLRLALRVIASKGGIMQSASDSIGRNQGLEIFDNSDLETFAKSVAKSAITMLEADEMEGQMLPVVIHNAFGGVILHEACGHALEATSVAKGISVFSGKLGTKIASDIVTAVDDGTLPNYWGSANIDDEGTKTQRNVLIEKGILKSYLVDKRNARKMKCDITASSRRQSYRFH
jgi:TldD protein